MQESEIIEILPIDRYLPQKRPFLMVDEIIKGGEKVCKTHFIVRQENPLFRGETFTEAGLIENIAQTAAAHIGYVEIHIRKTNLIRVGVIAAIKSLEIFRLPHRGEDLTTTVEETMSGIMNMSIYNAEIKIGEELIAKGEIRVAITQ